MSEACPVCTSAIGLVPSGNLTPTAVSSLHFVEFYSPVSPLKSLDDYSNSVPFTPRALSALGLMGRKDWCHYLSPWGKGVKVRSLHAGIGPQGSSIEGHPGKDRSARPRPRPVPIPPRHRPAFPGRHPVRPWPDWTVLKPQRLLETIGRGKIALPRPSGGRPGRHSRSGGLGGQRRGHVCATGAPEQRPAAGPRPPRHRWARPTPATVPVSFQAGRGTDRAEAPTPCRVPPPIGPRVRAPRDADAALGP